MKRVLFLLALLPSALFAQGYIPQSSGELIEHSHYSLSYVEDHEQAEWVYYSLTPSMVSGEASRKDNFRVDPNVSTASATLNDYKGSGYDRGHICPAADMSFSAEAMSESFYMSNMSPQHPSFNRGRWKQAEELVRDMALTTDSLYVVSGPIFRDNIETIGDGVTVPGYYFKAVYAPQKGAMWAIVMPNRKIAEELSDYVCSVDYVEELTGIDLFYQLEDEAEEDLESSVNDKL